MILEPPTLLTLAGSPLKLMPRPIPRIKRNGSASKHTTLMLQLIPMPRGIPGAAECLCKFLWQWCHRLLCARGRYTGTVVHGGARGQLVACMSRNCLLFKQYQLLLPLQLQLLLLLGLLLLLLLCTFITRLGADMSTASTNRTMSAAAAATTATATATATATNY